MTDDQFEEGLRRGLATLAREAVSDFAERSGDDVAEMEALPRRDRPAGRRVLAVAVGVAITVVAATVVLAAWLRRDETRSARVLTPQPSVSAVPVSPLGPRDSQASVFTGKEVLIWGGHDQATTGVTPSARAANPSAPTALADGAAYDVATRRWRRLPPAPIVARFQATAVWTGSEMVVVGGLSDAVSPSASGVSRQGAAYDPARNRWRRIPDAPTCVEGIGGISAWTGTQVVVGGNCSGTSFRLAAYDPVRNTWTGLPAPAEAFQLVVVGTRLYAWNGSANRGAVLDPRTRRWLPLPELRTAGTVNSIAVAYGGTQLAVVGPRVSAAGETFFEAEVDLLDPSGRSWRRETSTKVGPPQDTVVSTESGLVWNIGPGYGWFRVDPSSGKGEMSSVADGPVSLYRINGTLLAIGDRRAFFWGGQSIQNGGSGTSRPSADGGILEFP